MVVNTCKESRLYVCLFLNSKILWVSMKSIPLMMKSLCAGVMVGSSVRYVMTYWQPFSWGMLKYRAETFNVRQM